MSFKKSEYTAWEVGQLLYGKQEAAADDRNVVGIELRK